VHEKWAYFMPELVVRPQKIKVFGRPGGGTLELGSNVSLGYRTIINCHQNISIGDNVNIAPDVKIYDHDHNFKDHPLSGNEWRTSFITEKIEIGSNVWIGANTIILRGTIIGDNTVIGAGCILKGKFDGNCVITQKRNTSIKALKADS
jgi:acetyltransferase-like isoleucine patch superfamily enzyme